MKETQKRKIKKNHNLFHLKSSLKKRKGELCETILMEFPFKDYHHTTLWVHQLALYHNSSAVPLLFGLLWPEVDLSLLVPLGAKLCF